VRFGRVFFFSYFVLVSFFRHEQSFPKFSLGTCETTASNFCFLFSKS